MNAILALHGNPGHPDDWNLLKNHLPPLVAVDAYADHWIEQLLLAKTQRASPRILLGHSWGCYQILKNLPRLREMGLLEQVSQIVLINPYIVVEKPLSGLAATLLKMPWLGEKLIRASHEKSRDSFTDEMIFPARRPDLPYYQTIHDRFRDWKNWQRAAFEKIKMQASPLDSTSIVDVPLLVLLGDQDRVSLPDRQLSFLRLYPRVQIEILPNAGHGLPWSHATLLSEKIKSLAALTAPENAPGKAPANENGNKNGKGHENGTGNAIGYFPGSDTRNNVISYMEKHLREFPDRVALRWANRAALQAWDKNPLSPIAHDQVTYRDFAARITSFAQGLLDIGIAKGDRVIIFLPMSLDMYTAMFAVQRIGAIAVFLDSWARSHHLGASAKCVEPKAMISFKMAFDLVDQVPEFATMPIRILYGPDEGQTAKITHLFPQLLKGPSPICPVESEFTALITFTTGSTGTPKGANRTHRFLSAQHRALSHVIPYTEKDVDMPAFPIFSLNNLAAGVTTVLPALDLSSPAAHDSALLAAQIINENINCTTLSPSMLVGLANFCQEKSMVLSGLRRVVTGGAPISKDDVKAFYEIAPQTELWILYGSTEAEPMAHIEGREMLEEKSGDPEIIEEGVNVGHISEDIDFKFIRVVDGPIGTQTDWQGLELPAGQVGEFICTGDHVCRDYYNNPEAFHAVKIMDAENRVWHRTGDLAYIDEARNLWIVGRTNNAIEREGIYYFPVRAEVLLKRLDFVARCAFLGLPDAGLGQATYAVIELKEDLKAQIQEQSFDFPAARKEVRRVFAKNKIPVDHIKFVHRIPMDPRHHSKVEYKVLKTDLLNPEALIA